MRDLCAFSSIFSTDSLIVIKCWSLYIVLVIGYWFRRFHYRDFEVWTIGGNEWVMSDDWWCFPISILVYVIFSMLARFSIDWRWAPSSLPLSFGVPELSSFVLLLVSRWSSYYCIGFVPLQGAYSNTGIFKKIIFIKNENEKRKNVCII